MADSNAAGTPWQEPGRDRNHATSKVARSDGFVPLASDPLAAFVDMLATAVAEKLRASPAGPRWLSLAAAAEHCGVKVRTISAARRRGELVGRPAGHSFVFEVAALDAWLASRTTPTRPAGPMSDDEIVAASVRGAR